MTTESKRLIIDLVNKEGDDYNNDGGVVIENIYVKSKNNVENNNLTEEEKTAIVRILERSEEKILECIIDENCNIYCNINDILIAYMSVSNVTDRYKLKTNILNLIDSALREL